MRVAVLCRSEAQLPILPVTGQQRVLQEGGREAELGQAGAATGHPLRDGGGSRHHPVLLVWPAVPLLSLLCAGQAANPALFWFTLVPCHGRVSRLNTSWLLRYFPDASAMEQVACSWALLSARWVFPYATARAIPVRGCLESCLYHWSTQSQEPALGPIFHLGESWRWSYGCKQASCKISRALFIYLFQPVTNLGEYLDASRSSQKSTVYIWVSRAESAGSGLLTARQRYAGSAGMSLHNLALALPDGAWVGRLLIPSLRGQKFSSVFLIAELRGVGERESKLSSESSQASHRAISGGGSLKKRGCIGGVVALHP